MQARRPVGPGRAPGGPRETRLPGRSGHEEARIPLRQMALYLLALLAGMLVALLMDSSSDAAALRPGAAHSRCVRASSPHSSRPRFRGTFPGQANPAAVTSSCLVNRVM